jgi:hypothetical protein
MASEGPTVPDVDEGEAVDASLVDAMLRLTPEQRLRQNDRMLRTIKDLRDAFAAARADDASLDAGPERR